MSVTSIHAAPPSARAAVPERLYYAGAVIVGLAIAYGFAFHHLLAVLLPIGGALLFAQRAEAAGRTHPAATAAGHLAAADGGSFPGTELRSPVGAPGRSTVIDGGLQRAHWPSPATTPVAQRAERQ